MKRFFLLLGLLGVLAACHENTPDPALSLSTQSISLPQSGGFVDFTVFANTSWTLDNPQQYVITPTSGQGSATLRLTVPENPQVGVSLTGVVSFVSSAPQQDLTIYQDGISPFFDIFPTAIHVSWDAAVLQARVSSNLSCTVTCDADWCTVTPTQTAGSTTLSLSLTSNRNGDQQTEARRAVITITSTALDYHGTIEVTQDGYVVNERMLDSLQLVQFYTLTDGPHWAKNQWNLQTPMDTWPGVRLNQQGRVDSLSIPSGVIATPGPIPDCVGNLPALVALSLSNNGFTGSIPESIGNLTQLRRLSISTNPNIKGTFPDFVCALTSLERLSFSSMTGLTGSLPVAIGQLTKLVDFNIVGCTGLSGSIPPEIGLLVNLTNLQMNNVPFTGTIPPEMGNMRSLINLGLYNTKLSLPIPDAFFDGLKHMASILLHKNENFNGPLPEGFGRMTTTADRFSVRLEECNFTGSIPQSWAHIPMVSTQLRVFGNRLTGSVPEAVKAHTCWNSDIWNPALYICPQQEGYGFTDCQ